MKNTRNDYMESIYELLNSPEEEFEDDGITYIGNPDDEEFFYDDELAWADNITYLDEPEDDEFDFQDLGDDYIPLPQGDIIYEQQDCSTRTSGGGVRSKVVGRGGRFPH